MPFTLTVPLILASGSPRRKKLLEQLGLTFHVHVSPAEEVVPEGLPPEDVVRRLALEKAHPVAALYPGALTLAADTIVCLNGEILGKPADAEEACRMLTRLQDATHTVHTGIALVHPDSGRETAASEATDVTFGPMTAREIAAYVATGSPLDKAGAYGIQDDHGALFIRGIVGDYYTVMGLPLHRLYRVIRNDFTDLLAVDP